MGISFLQEIASAFWENLWGNWESNNIIPHMCLWDPHGHPLHIHFEWFGNTAHSQQLLLKESIAWNFAQNVAPVFPRNWIFKHKEPEAAVVYSIFPSPSIQFSYSQLFVNTTKVNLLKTRAICYFWKSSMPEGNTESKVWHYKQTREFSMDFFFLGFILFWLWQHGARIRA